MAFCSCWLHAAHMTKGEHAQLEEYIQHRMDSLSSRDLPSCRVISKQANLLLLKERAQQRHVCRTMAAQATGAFSSSSMPLCTDAYQLAAVSLEQCEQYTAELRGAWNVSYHHPGSSHICLHVCTMLQAGPSAAAAQTILPKMCRLPN